MQFVLGIDNGGTKCLLKAAAPDGRVLAAYTGHPSSHFGQTRENAYRLIEENVSACLQLFGGRLEDCLSVVCGASGIDSPEDADIVHSLYAALPGLNCPILCVNDAQLAHYTVTGGVGALLIAGTGSVVFGRNEAGREMQVAGLSASIMGDEGSGRYVDGWALHHYSRYLDGCRERTRLVEEIEKKLGKMTRKQLVDLSEKMASAPWPSVGLGEALNTAAQAGDRTANTILRCAAWWNMRMLQDLLKGLGYQKEDVFTVGIWGSTILKGKVQQWYFREMLSKKYPNARIKLPDRDAADGAVEWALARLRNG
ncbi:MAG: N-acetylglucosamine kinase [Clostridiales bacterium]|nr:N-acetylglucosamine kinase [Clostridiales bacterium]